MESQVISDAQITASTQWDNDNSAKFARLNLGGWVAGAVDPRQWLQVDLGTYSSVTSVATQGVNLYWWPKCWTASYNLQYSDDGITFHFYKGPGETLPKVYTESNTRLNLKITLKNTFLRLYDYCGLSRVSREKVITMLSPLASCHVENFLFRSHSRSRYSSYGCMLRVNKGRARFLRCFYSSSTKLSKN